MRCRLLGRKRLRRFPEPARSGPQPLASAKRRRFPATAGAGGHSSSTACTPSSMSIVEPTIAMPVDRAVFQFTA